MTLARRLAAEALGTGLLLAVVVGSGIMGERLAMGNPAIALLANSLATGCGLWVLITLFALPLYSASQHARAGPAQWWSEGVATAGLMLTIWLGDRHGARWVAGLVAAYITAAYWFTASTSFANPAVTLARSLTDTFAGIRPADVPGFVVAELIAAIGATFVARWFTR